MVEKLLLDSYDYIFKFEIQKCGQILCARKPCFLMPGHIHMYLHIFAKRIVLYCFSIDITTF